MLYKVGLTFPSVDEILKCDQVLYGMLYTIVLTSESLDRILKYKHSKEGY